MDESLKALCELKIKTSKTTKDKEKYQIIYGILKDKECFKKMKTETAYKLLSDLDFEKDEIKTIYNEIIFKD